MFKLKEQTKPLSSVVAALELYDGCEFDVRMTRDRVLVIHHDAEILGQRLINTDYQALKGVSSFDELIHHPQVIQLVNEEDKTLWIEAKEDSSFKVRKDSSLRRSIARKLTEELTDSGLNLDNITIISFCDEILTHVKGIRRCHIVPYIFSATDSYFPYYNLKTIFQMFVSLQRHIKRAIKMGYDGLLFSKHYLQGFFSFFQPSVEKILSWKTEDFILGTEAQTFKEEMAFKDFFVFTDYHEERKEGRGTNAGTLICHRGL
jgi:glycerophosphoryl diester phosphodiesterase